MLSNMQIIDISRALTLGHPNWPGDAPYSLNTGAAIQNGDSVNTSVLSTSTHTGTHVDAPWHYDDQAARLHQVPLEHYLGRCHVISVPANLPFVPASLLEQFETLPARILLNTGQPTHWESFPEDFTAISPEFIEAAAQKGVQLLGTDAPSVDPLTSKTLEAHKACLANNILILEGLNLSQVTDGEYELIALPLPLHDADASPVRAVLRPVEGMEQ